MVNCKNIEISIHLEACNEANIYLFDKDKLVSHLESLGYIDNYAFIYHNEEIEQGITNHIHLMLQFKQTMAIDRLATDFKVETQNLEKIKGRWSSAIAYLTHANKPLKHQYQTSQVVSNFDIVKATNEALEKTSRDNYIKELLSQYGSCKLSYKKVMDNITPLEYHNYNSLIKHMREYRQNQVKDRDMQVIYITGESGSGKTTLAKFLADNQGYDYFVSGSGKDILDGYDKEECIILDDLRADTFTKSELFKLCDNNTNSSVKSRYQNKDISHCKLMIITSIKTPLNLYDWDKDDVNEPFKQFARRLNYHYLNVYSTGAIRYYKLVQSPKEEFIQEWENDAPLNMQLVFGYYNIVKGGEMALDSLISSCLSHALESHKELNENSDNDDSMPF